MGFNASISAKINAGDTRYMLTRQASMPLWGDYPAANDTNKTLSYGVVYNFTTLAASTPSAVSTIPSVYVEPTDQVGAWWQDINYGVGAPSRTNFGGPWPVSYPVVGVDAQTGELPWVYIPDGAITLLTMTGQPYTYNTKVTLELWANPGQSAPYTPAAATLTSTTVNTSAGTTLSIPGNSWVRIRALAIGVNTGSIPNGNFTVTLGCALTNTLPVYTPSATAGTWNLSSSPDDKWYFLPLTVSPEFKNSPLPWMATRLNAVAALFTNTTKVLNKEGTVLWGRTNPNLVNPFNVQKTTVESLHPAEKAFLDLEHGTYAYNPPSTDLASFLNYSVYIDPLSSSATLIPVYRLDNTAFTAQAFFSDPDGGTSLAINLDYHIEFRTSSTLFQIGVSTVPLETLHMAQVALLRSGFFFNNFDHTALINRIVKFAASMHPLLAMAAPVMNGIIGATNYAISSRPKAVNRPAATSGQGAGIVAKPSSPPQRRPKRRQVRVNRKPPQRNSRPPRGKNGLRGGLDLYLAQKK